MVDSHWHSKLEELAAQIRWGDFARAEATAKNLNEKRAEVTDWPPADLDNVRLYVFDPSPEAGSNPKLGKWADSLNRLMHKLLEGEFHEVARVSGIMKRYADPYTPLILAKDSSARDLPGLTCRLSARHD